MPAVNGVGEPCAGEPHARFEVAGAGNGADLTKGTGVAQPPGNRRQKGPRPYRQRATAPVPDPTRPSRTGVAQQPIVRVADVMQPPVAWIVRVTGGELLQLPTHLPGPFPLSFLLQLPDGLVQPHVR